MVRSRSAQTTRIAGLKRGTTHTFGHAERCASRVGFDACLLRHPTFRARVRTPMRDRRDLLSHVRKYSIHFRDVGTRVCFESRIGRGCRRRTATPRRQNAAADRDRNAVHDHQRPQALSPQRAASLIISLHGSEVPRRAQRQYVVMFVVGHPKETSRNCRPHISVTVRQRGQPTVDN